jgi:hypothetical protein
MSYKVYSQQENTRLYCHIAAVTNNSESELVHFPDNYYTNSTFFAASKTASLFINLCAFNPVSYLDD